MGLREMSLLVVALLSFPFLDGSFRFSRAQTISPVPPYTFVVKNTSIKTTCGESYSVLTVNDMIPGPEIRVKGNQSILVRVENQLQEPDGYGITIHWHGVKQPRNPWADGPEYVTQCPIQPGQSYTYNISLSDEVGTIWWHAHSGWSRLTVYGAFVILPPDEEDTTSPIGSQIINHTLIFGSWYDINSAQLQDQHEHLEHGNAGNLYVPNRYTINGKSGDQYDCVDTTEERIHDFYNVTGVKSGTTYLLRIVNAAMLEAQYFGIRSHKLKVVARDGALVEQFETDYVVIFPGESMDVQFVANQSPGEYYMAFYSFVNNGPFYTTGFVIYADANIVDQVLPSFPVYGFNVAKEFIDKTKSLEDRSAEVPQSGADVTRYNILVGQTANLNCNPTTGACTEGGGNSTFAHLNKASFLPDTSVSILQAYKAGDPSKYDTNFPSATSEVITRGPTPKVIQLEYGKAVEIVFEGTGGAPFHPMHLHGYSFFLVGMGVDQAFDPVESPKSYNYTHPPEVNTVTLFNDGWTAVRFYARNPGVWFVHCHIETHVSRGMATAIIVEDGTEEDQKVLDPPTWGMPACGAR